jgi:hypothetical protein
MVSLEDSDLSVLMLILLASFSQDLFLLLLHSE